MRQNENFRHKHGGFTLIEATTLLGTVGLGAAILLPAFGQIRKFVPKPKTPSAHCLRNLQQLGLAFMQYTQDYDERTPPVSLSASVGKGRVLISARITEGPYKGGTSFTANEDYSPYGWADAMQQYNPDPDIHQCPSDRFALNGNPKKRGYTDYWYNYNAAGKSLAQFDNYKHIVIVGDGDGGSSTSTARYSINALPTQWLGNPNSPARRHAGGAHYLYLDGHVKWLRPQYLSQKGIKQGGRNTFIAD